MTTEIHVGTSPAGVAWNVYLKPGENYNDLANRAAVQGRNLDLHWARYWAKPVRVNLTVAQVGHVEDVVVEGTEFAQAVEILSMSVRAARADLRELAMRLGEESDLETCIEHVEQFSDKDLTEAQVQFGAESRYKSQQATIHKIDKAVA